MKKLFVTSTIDTPPANFMCMLDTLGFQDDDVLVIGGGMLSLSSISSLKDVGIKRQRINEFKEFVNLLKLFNNLIIIGNSVDMWTKNNIYRAIGNKLTSGHITELTDMLSSEPDLLNAYNTLTSKTCARYVRYIGDKYTSVTPMGIGFGQSVYNVTDEDAFSTTVDTIKVTKAALENNLLNFKMDTKDKLDVVCVSSYPVQHFNNYRPFKVGNVVYTDTAPASSFSFPGTSARVRGEFSITDLSGGRFTRAKEPKVISIITTPTIRSNAKITHPPKQLNLLPVVVTEKKEKQKLNAYIE